MLPDVPNGQLESWNELEVSFYLPPSLSLLFKKMDQYVMVADDDTDTYCIEPASSGLPPFEASLDAFRKDEGSNTIRSTTVKRPAAEAIATFPRQQKSQRRVTFGPREEISIPVPSSRILHSRLLANHEIKEDEIESDRRKETSEPFRRSVQVKMLKSSTTQHGQHPTNRRLKKLRRGEVP
ncbi:unnamed protein product [Notodromas monacha]|uniref:Uncharacterized protein n=1 Tax=Notodromas monacha TaxID=399045 RepID=A0A7R9G965_9CRUS|nr:unnamed protein product [Notodromas monacha]CAG0912845.1 unnamed protein product [Notodromas monacha]